MSNDFKKIAPLETFLGFVIICFSAVFVWWAAGVVETKSLNDTIYSVEFENSAGIDVGADVKINGVKVGSIVSKTLNKDSYKALVKYSIDSKFKIPVDSKIQIASEGLLGGKNLVVEIGRSEFYLSSVDVATGESIKSLEDLIGDVIFSMSNKEKTAETK